MTSERPTNRPPRLSKGEQQRASILAAMARKERSAVKAEVAAGRLAFFTVCNDPRPAIRKMRVKELLEAVPGIGELRARSIMERCQISENRRIAGLGRHQISALREEALVTKVEPPIGALIVISGPGGVGKSTITGALRGDPRFWVSVSATTRAPRHYEKEGVDYYFYSESKFDQMVAAQEFLEWAEFAGARYGTPKSPIEQWRRLGKHVILEIEIAGARQVRQADPSAVLVFISPPSWEELEKRLSARGTDSPERKAARLALAQEEIAASSEFDHILINSQVEDVLSQLIDLATSHTRT